jgi:hypothetical protein
MAKMRCTCNEVMSYDDPGTGHRLLTDEEFDISRDSADLLGLSRDVWRCPNCGRLWVYWDDWEATEYVPVAAPDDE